MDKNPLREQFFDFYQYFSTDFLALTLCPHVPKYIGHIIG